jgi:twinkle protein
MLGALEQGHKVCIASLELKADLLLKRLTQQAAGLASPSEEYIQAITNWYRNKLWVFDLVGTAKTERLLEVFLYARQRYGVEMFVIDSFLKCGISEEDYAEQKKFVEQLCDFKNEHDCHIHLIVHPRKGVDESKYPGKMDVKGTGAVTDLADNCFSVWRNKAKENEIRIMKAKNEPLSEVLKKPDCLWICDKQRNGDWEGKLPFWFDAKSYQYLESQNGRAINYVDYSSSK